MDGDATSAQCAGFCADEGECRAWTYKYAMGGEPPLCFLKSGVPNWNRDERFVSGVRGEAAPEAEEEPVIGEGGGDERVGAGCPGAEAPAEKAPAEEGPPASASYNLLPLIRLPGNDLYILNEGDGVRDWLDCRQACTEDPNCRAFTYQGGAKRCLIKSGAGMHIPALNHQSGIKR